MLTGIADSAFATLFSCVQSPGARTRSHRKILHSPCTKMGLHSWPSAWITGPSAALGLAGNDMMSRPIGWFHFAN